MPRLPIPGSDDGNWGDLLNEYLSVEHNADGSQKTLPVSKGGTGATSAAAALSSLGGISSSAAQAIADTAETDAIAAAAADATSKADAAQAAAIAEIPDSLDDFLTAPGGAGTAPISNGNGTYTPSNVATQAELDSAIASVTANNQTDTSYTLVLTDAGKVVELNNASAITLTVPPSSSVAFPIGTVVNLWQQGVGQVTISPGSGVTIRARGGALKLHSQYAGAVLRKRATDEWELQGDVTT